MRILRYLLEIAFLYGLFQLGKTMAAHDEGWAHSLAHDAKNMSRWKRFFLYVGRTFQWLACIWGFIDAVAVLILATGLLSDLALGM